MAQETKKACQEQQKSFLDRIQPTLTFMADVFRVISFLLAPRIWTTGWVLIPKTNNEDEEDDEK